MIIVKIIIFKKTIIKFIKTSVHNIIVIVIMAFKIKDIMITIGILNRKITTLQNQQIEIILIVEKRFIKKSYLLI